MTSFENPFKPDAHLKAPIRPDTPPAVPENEMEITFVRSSGPGGQKVNKTSSKAVIRWNIDASSAYSDEEKARIRERLAHRITKEGDLIVTRMQERSQLQNKLDAIQTLRDVVSEALKEEKERVGTKPTRAAKMRRLDEKKQNARKKVERKGGWEE
ncbi:MAG: alternative ribosome rescue aminoacyl-tRNA hydrolase ArfB [Patescibacteria group bacterium]